MQSPDARAIARECLPGRGEIELEHLSRGLFNDTYRADRDGRQFALRLARAPTLGGGAARSFEARLVAQAASCRLAPPLVYSDPGRGILVLDWLPGEPWDGASIASGARIEQAAGLIRRIHALTAPLPTRRLSPDDWVGHYRHAVAARVTPMLAALQGPGDRVLQALAVMPPETPVICHSDLHRFNVLEVRAGGDSLLLDWEYAHVNGPCWDLAGWSANNDFTPAQSRALLAAYDDESDRTCWRRFGLSRWVFDYVCALWINLYQLETTQPSPELVSRAAQLETRLNAAVCGKLADSDRHFFLET